MLGALVETGRRRCVRRSGSAPAHPRGTRQRGARDRGGRGEPRAPPATPSSSWRPPASSAARCCRRRPGQALAHSTAGWSSTTPRATGDALSFGRDPAAIALSQRALALAMRGDRDGARAAAAARRSCVPAVTPSARRGGTAPPRRPRSSAASALAGREPRWRCRSPSARASAAGTRTHRSCRLGARERRQAAAARRAARRRGGWTRRARRSCARGMPACSAPRSSSAASPPPASPVDAASRPPPAASAGV